MNYHEIPLRIIATGGTFDKKYDELSGNLTFDTSYLSEILEYARCRIPVSLEFLPLIDSLEMREENREKILDACRQAPEDRIIITHGTDTMQITAEYLAGKTAKTVVLTGAMIPYSISHSDAVFNLGTAVGASGLLPAGVYICMNGAVFNWNNVRKNREGGYFEPVT